MLIPRRSTRTRAAALTATLAAAVLALSSCDSGDGGGKSDAADKGLTVVAPGKPGEPATTMSAEDAVKAAAGNDRPNSADFRYTRMMIEHHEQALVLTGLVPDRASSTPVKRLAGRISAGQKPEIAAMEGWLTNNDADAREETHDHSAMPGMATAVQLKKLRAARGKAFDTLFLELMITHHQGSVTMATEALADGNNVLVEEMANDVVAQQTVEIDRMRGLMS